MLKIAIQKSGRLYEDSTLLLKNCGFSIDNSNDQLKAQVRNFDAEILFLRNSDIPKYIEEGVVDVGILGQNSILEKNVDVEELLLLGFSKCRLSIAAPEQFPFLSVQDLQGKRIATSYPFTLQKYLLDNKIDAEIHLISGSVEIAPHIGLADVICDLVSSGNTLFKNNLVEKEIIAFSEAGLFANKQSVLTKKAQIDELIFRIKAVNEAKNFDYILFNIPTDRIIEASQILPGLKSPTVLPLVDDGWSSMHSVIEKNSFWELINELKKVGAEGILVSPLSKIVM